MTEVDISLPEELQIKPPSLYDIHKSFDYIKTNNYDGIVGEEHARMVLFTNWVLGENHIIMRGSSSSGKTNCIDIVSSYVKEPFFLGASSEKGYIRNKNINEATHLIIPEVNKINDQTQELLKDFGEGKPSYYTFNDKHKNPVTIIIQPKPFVTSIADENKNVLPAELINRITNVYMDSSVEQTKKVMQVKAQREENPFKRNEVSQKKLKELQDYVKNLPSIKEFGFINLGASKVLSFVPPLFCKARRDIQKYWDNCKAIALFHLNDRIVITKNNKRYIILTPQDYWINHLIFSQVMI